MKIEQLLIQSMAPQSQSRFDRWARILKAANVKAMVEIGVWNGDFASTILEQCEFLNRYYMIDPWANLPDWNKPLIFGSESFDDIYAEAIGKTDFAAANRSC